MPARGYHDATLDETRRLARALSAARTVADEAELAALHETEPWRIQVNGRGDVAVLGRWRDHLPFLAIEALWCPSNRIPHALEHIRTLGQARGLTDVVSPPLPVEEMHSYQTAGMHPDTVVATYRLKGLEEAAVADADTPATIRAAGLDDVAILLELDARCFGPFWRYDERHLRRFCLTGRMSIAEREGQALGYTLCTFGGDEGLLGRLCVVPEARRQGIGFALVCDAAAYVRAAGGAQVLLSTQTDNVAARALYLRAGFRDTGRRYAFLRFGSDQESG